MKYRLSFLFFLTLFFLASCNNADIKQGNNTVHEKSVMDTLPQELVFNLQEILENKGENGLIKVVIAYDHWREEDILAFALNPKSYRSSSQMPPMRDVLSIDEIKTIINYLKFVSKQKVVN